MGWQDRRAHRGHLTQALQLRLFHINEKNTLAKTRRRKEIGYALGGFAPLRELFF